MVLKIIAGLYPVLMDFVKSIESALPEAGQGQAKLALIKQTLESAYAHMGDAEVKFESIWPSLQVVVGAIVAMYNTAGVFKKTGATPPPQQ